MRGDQAQQLAGYIAGATEHNDWYFFAEDLHFTHSTASVIARGFSFSASITQSPSAAPSVIALNAATPNLSRMMFTPTALSVAGPVTTVGSMPNCSRSSFTPPHAATGSFADRTTEVSAERMSGADRIASTPYAPRMPSPSSNTITSGSPCDISVSSARVIAGPVFAVVVTTPRSEKIMLLRAPASSIARMSRRKETPVALNACTFRPGWRMRATMAHAAAVLPASIQVPASATTGTLRVLTATL